MDINFGTTTISLIILISCLLIFNLNKSTIKYIIPAAIELGVFSGIKLFCSTRIAINLHIIIISDSISNLLQYRSINESGVVWCNIIFSFGDSSLSKLFIILTAFLQPFVADAWSNLKIPAISFALLGNLLTLAEIYIDAANIPSRFNPLNVLTSDIFLWYLNAWIMIMFVNAI